MSNFIDIHAPYIGNVPQGSAISADQFPNDGAYTPRTFLVRENNLSPMTFTGTNTWILHEPGEQTCYIVDPGNTDEDHFANLEHVCANLKLQPLAILLTHTHDDHAEGASALEKRMDISTYSLVDGSLKPGSFALPGSCLDLQVIPMPGHSADCVGLLLPAEGTVLTGDTIFAWGSTIVAGGGSLKMFFDTLDVQEQLVRQGKARLFLPGHGRMIDDPLTRIQQYRAHRLKRLDQVRAAIRTIRSLDADRLYPQIYTDTDPRLEGPAKRNIAQQLRYLEEIEDPVLQLVP